MIIRKNIGNDTKYWITECLVKLGKAKLHNNIKQTPWPNLLIPECFT